MHEMGIAAEVARIALEALETHGGGRVNALHLKIGLWSGVEPESLTFALGVMGEDTPLAGCRVEIERIQPTFACPVK